MSAEKIVSHVPQCKICKHGIGSHGGGFLQEGQCTVEDCLCNPRRKKPPAGSIIITREQLEGIEWISNFDRNYVDCPACHNYQEDGHTDDCWVGTALNSGKQL